MAKTVVINNTSFIIPESGDENYAEDLTAFLEELSTVINSLSAPLDIVITDFIVENDQSTLAPVTGFSIPTTNITKFVADYVLSRKTTTPLTLSESGRLVGLKTASGEWNMSRIDTEFDNDGIAVDDTGIEFEMTDNQLEYTSTSLPNHDESKLTFRVRTFEQ